MKNIKISPPVAVGLFIAAILLLGFVIYRGTHGAAGDTGDISALAGEVKDSNPKNAPPMPKGIDPTAGARGMGGGGGKKVASGPGK